MSKPQFVYVTYIDTTPEKLWEALTNGEFTRQYWGGRRIESDWQEGSVVRHLKEDGSLDWHGKVLAADPPRRLSYSFDPATDDEMPGYEGDRVDLNDPENASRVTFEITEHMGQLRLTLVHDQFEEGSKVLQGVSHGWPAILSSLKTLLERGEPLFPDWR